MKKNAVLALLAIAAFAVMAFGDTLINGAGATFPFPMYSKWFNEYKKKDPMVQINYQSRGSGAGIQQVTAGTVDFGAADVPMTDMQIADFTKQRGSEILHFPTVLGAVVPTYDIKGVTATLNFTGDALAGIYLGKITKWNDPAIASANPGVMLPNADIVVVHRAEASGTSFIWTDYLSKVSPEWKMKVGAAASVNWPVGLGGQGNEGVSGQIKQTGNTIGYVELIFALQNKMPYGKVKNANGEFIAADLNSVTAAAAGAAKAMPEDFRVSITNAPGKGAYPISSFTWLLIPAKIQDPTKKKAITDFLNWMLKDGQTMTQALSFAPLPKEVVAKETKAIAKIK
jgi:phosphate transport system substrate-binding protein